MKITVIIYGIKQRFNKHFNCNPQLDVHYSTLFNL